MKNAHFLFLCFYIALSSVKIEASRSLLETENSSNSDPFNEDFPDSYYQGEMSAEEFIKLFISKLSREAIVINIDSGALEIHGIHKVPLQDAPIEFFTSILVILSQNAWTAPWGPTFDFTKASFIYPISKIKTKDSRSPLQSLYSLLDENSTKTAKQETPVCQLLLFLSGNSNSPIQLTNKLRN